jgi:hypothetical protein
VRRAPVFFYGLFMDQGLLRERGLEPEDGELAALDGFALRLGRRATLVPAPGQRVHGLLVSVALAELGRLYADPSLESYRPEAVLARGADGGAVAALCYNLAPEAWTGERDQEYAAKLRALAERIGLPADYVASI